MNWCFKYKLVNIICLNWLSGALVGVGSFRISSVNRSGTHGGAVLCLALRDGSERWRADAGDVVSESTISPQIPSCQTPVGLGTFSTFGKGFSIGDPELAAPGPKRKQLY